MTFTDPDALLILRVQVGDERAFSGLYERFGERTHRYLRGIVASEADDVQQEVWLSVFREISRLSNPAAFRTWLFRLTRNRAIDVLRRRKREGDSTEISDELYAQSEDVRMDPDLLAQLEIAMDRLSAKHREVVMLRYWEEMSYADISLVVDQPVGTVRSRLHVAKQELRKNFPKKEREE